MTGKIRIKDIARMADVSVGTVDRVLHGRGGVSTDSRRRVEEVLQRLDYHPNVYASILASNRQYLFCCLLPQHGADEYWSEVELGIHDARQAYADFNLTVTLFYYDPYDYHSFGQAACRVAACVPDGVVLAPTAPQHTKAFTDGLAACGIPFIYIDSDIKGEPALSFFGQNSHRSGCLAARVLMLLAGAEAEEVVVFRKKNEGIVGSNQQEHREVGFREYMERHHPQCRILELDLQAKHEAGDGQMLDDFFACHPGVGSGVTFNSKAYVVGEYLQRQGRRGFNLVGYDLLRRNVDCLRAGSICFLIAQQPRLQGYDCIKTLCDSVVLKRTVERVHYMPIDLLTKENIDFYPR